MRLNWSTLTTTKKYSSQDVSVFGWSFQKKKHNRTLWALTCDFARCGTASSEVHFQGQFSSKRGSICQFDQQVQCQVCNIDLNGSSLRYQTTPIYGKHIVRTDKSVRPPRPDIPWSWGSQTGGSFRLRLRKENFEHFPSIRAICVSKCRDKQGNSRVELAFYHRRPHQLCVPNKLTSPTLPLNDLVSIYFLLLSNWQKTRLNWATCPSAVIRTQIP